MVFVDGVGCFQQDQIRTCSECDLVAAISFSPYSTGTEKNSEAAATAGANVLAVTASELSPLCATATNFDILFTPTSASWLNMVEPFFRDLMDKRIRRDVFRDVNELIAAIDDYIAGHNMSPKLTACYAELSESGERPA